MRIVWTEASLTDLDDILTYVADHFPSLGEAVERRIRAVAERIGEWPESARVVDERAGVRVAPLVRYPYRVFYRVRGSTVEILHIHHGARDD